MFVVLLIGNYIFFQIHIIKRATAHRGHIFSFPWVAFIFDYNICTSNALFINGKMRLSFIRQRLLYRGAFKAGLTVLYICMKEMLLRQLNLLKIISMKFMIKYFWEVQVCGFWYIVTFSVNSKPNKYKLILESHVILYVFWLV